MSVTVIKEGNVLRLLDSTQSIPDGTALVLYTAGETPAPPALSAFEAAQLDSVFREDGEDWGDSLDSLLVRESWFTRPAHGGHQAQLKVPG